MPLTITQGYGVGEVITHNRIPSRGFGGTFVANALTDFQVDSLQLIGARVLRVRFTRPPKVTGGGVDDATNKTNYTLSGTSVPTLEIASPYSEDNEVIDLWYSDDLTVGDWTLSVSDTIVSTSGAPLIG